METNTNSIESIEKWINEQACKLTFETLACQFAPIDTEQLLFNLTSLVKQGKIEAICRGVWQAW